MAEGHSAAVAVRCLSQAGRPSQLKMLIRGILGAECRGEVCRGEVALGWHVSDFLRVLRLHA